MSTARLILASASLLLAVSACDVVAQPDGGRSGSGSSGPSSGSGGNGGDGGAGGAGGGSVPASCIDDCFERVAPDCPNGPTQASCEADCQAVYELCAEDIDALAACGPFYVCDGLGQPLNVGCDGEFAAYEACLVQ